MEPLLRVSALSMRYGVVQALNDIHFSLEPGEVVGLVGRRGSGKTSLLRAIAGATPASGGEIFFRGQRMNLISTSKARDAGIELIHETPRLTPHLDLISNIFMGREICWPPKIGLPDWKRMHARSRELLGEFDLPPGVLGQRVSSLTDEQRQLIAIARSLVNTPALLLLDEALATLSYPRQQIMLDRITSMARDGAGIIISSENLKHLFSVTNRILVLYEGRLVAERITAECTPRDIVELIVGTSNSEQVTPVVWALESFHDAQRQTEELFRAQATLHQSLEASDSLNRQLVRRLSDQVKALNRLNTALQQTQRRLLTDVEEKRKDLARELHDQIIQDLLSINYRLEEAEGGITSDEARQEMDSIRGGIRALVSDLRQMCQDLRPPTIDNHGLYSALRSYAQEWAERTSVRLDLDIDPEIGRLPEAIELSVFRIVQEGLTNIHKHANASKVELSLHRTPMDSLLVRLVDNGEGLASLPDLGSLSAEKHFGLLGISERAALLGGSMELKLPTSGGLVLQVEIPSPYPSV